MSDDFVKRIKNIGNQLIFKAQDLNKLAKIIPEQSKILRAYGEYYNYVAGEYERLPSKDVNVSDSLKFSLGDLEKTFCWTVPSAYKVAITAAMAAGTSPQITAIFLPYIDSKPELKLLDNPPESFKILKATGETIDKLNKLSEGLGGTWRDACNAMAMNDLSSIKTVAINARTAFDELSRLVPVEILKKLDWCVLHEKKPNRPTRFAWILYGEDLPESCNKNPSNDPSWKSFKINYDELQKYVHLSSLQKSNLIQLDIIMKALQGSMDHYLYFGYDRLISNLA
ncbi:MAG: hypothetical protein NT178_13850 [Proteobacteria bacterium]|nr:hypothetical protein [Pseudomonadota bacterium]